MDIFLESGYLNIPYLLAQHCPFIFVVGARGTGKTYGALLEAHKRSTGDGGKFMFMRRTQGQADIINKPEFSPFKALNTDRGWNIVSKPLSKYNAAFYDGVKDEESGEVIPQGSPIGYTAALSTISNMRGFDASDVTLMIYDEFIPERHERPIKEEGAALLNAYETVNRNRELAGLPPVQLLCLSNANDLGNAIFMELGLITKAEQMARKGQTLYINRDRGIMLVILQGSPISDAKRNTALYRLAAGSEFAGMALDNNWNLEISRVRSRPIKEYRPLVTVGELTIYEHKSSPELYVSEHRSGNPPTYGAGEVERGRFCRAYSWVWSAYMRNELTFENATCEVLLTKYFK